MTRPLYHESPQTLAFTGRVLNTDGSAAELDATAFYPEGGGQPGDVGTLRWAGGEARVTGTRRDKATGAVWHALDGAAPPAGAEVTGEVDADVRWRHMQRHSAEHLLAQAFLRVNPAFTVEAVSMMGPECHLDLQGQPSDADVQAAEALLRATLARGGLTLETPVMDDTELGDYPLRRTAKVSGRVRLVIFRDPQGEFYDVSACGGTHVPEAARCAPVVVLRSERIRSGLTRVTFMAGEEAGAYLSALYRENRRLAQGFSVPVERLSERVDALGAERDALKAELTALRTQLAAALVAATPAEAIGDFPVRFLSVSDAALLTPLLSGTPEGEVRVAVTEDGRCGIGSGTAAHPAGTLLRSALTVTGGKGGGKPELALGQTDTPTAFADAVRKALQPA